MFSHEQIDCPDHANALSWVALLQPYVKSTDVFRCPSFPGYSLPSLPNGSGPEIQGVGYLINPLQFVDSCRPHPVSWLRHSPSQVALFADAAYTYQNPQWGPWPWAWGVEGYLVYPFYLSKEWNHSADGNTYWEWNGYLRPVPDGSMEPLAQGRHGGGYNFAFADGHVRFLRPLIRYPRIGANGGWGVDGQWHRGVLHFQFGYFPGAMAD